MLRRIPEKTFRALPVEQDERASAPAPGEPIAAIAARYDRYSRLPMTDAISRHDDMYSRREAGAMNHYMHVGRSAIRVIASALVAAAKPDVRLILDLPCGGGRVTRHLRAFFPEA